MNYLTQIIPLIYLFMLFFLSTQQKQLLSALLILEIIIVTIIFTTVIIITKTITETFSIIVILTYAATGARIGLRTLVIIIRSHGSDTLNNLTKKIC